MNFREFVSAKELSIAAELIGKIDNGERSIFENGKSCEKFIGFIDRLYYTDGAVSGVYAACEYNNELHVSIAFDADLPAEAEEEMKAYIEKARRQKEGNANFWYRPEKKLQHCCKCCQE